MIIKITVIKKLDKGGCDFSALSSEWAVYEKFVLDKKFS